MDIMSIGSVNGYVKNMAMQQKWQAKKDSNDFTADGSKTVGEWLEKQKRAAEDKSDKPDNTLKNIHNKMSNGQKLTPSEREYLQKKDPQTYKKLQDIEAEQKKFEQDLRRCRTKEEVRRLKMTHAAQSLSTIKSVENNPNIPDEKKAEIIQGEQQKMSAFEKSSAEFEKSERYHALPTEAEKREAEKIMKEAEEERLCVEKEENISMEAAEKSCSESAPKNDAEAGNDAVTHFDANKAKDTVRVSGNKQDKGRKTAGAEQSPVVRKVKRAKAYYGYNEKAPQITAAANKTALDTEV